MNKTKPISFSGNFLTKDDDRLLIDEFKKVFVSSEETELIGNIVHTFAINFEDHYLMINFSVGSPFPRNPFVINTETKQSEPNPRQTNQIEPKDYFALIDFDTCLFWISNSKKRTLIINYINSKFENSSIVVKDVFDQEKFINCLKRLDEVRITATPDLFSQTNTLTKALSDEINQYEAIEAILHLKYQDKWIGNTLSDKISSIFRNKTNFLGIMISGRDEKNNGLLFNSNIFSKKIDFKAHIDENEMYDPIEVFNILISKIKDEKN